MLARIIANTKKQIIRSGKTAWASISIMALAFLVGTIFGGLAYASNMYIKFIESKSNVLVFFEEGMQQPEKATIDALQEKWLKNPKIKSITYTSEEEAYQIYSDYTYVTDKAKYEFLKTRENKTLPSSLDIQIFSLQDLSDVTKEISTDIDAANQQYQIFSASDTPASYSASPTSYAKFKYVGDTDDPSRRPITLKVDAKSLEQLKQVFNFLRLVGLAVLVLLFIGIFFFTFMAVEFRLQNQMEEIGVMQLVGGSLLFIRSPYILEGGFYGFAGSLISSFILGSFVYFVFVVNQSSQVTIFLYEQLGKLSWPSVSILGWLAIVFALGMVGFALGGMSSYLSIRRYIR